jgi:hypothetical protein
MARYKRVIQCSYTITLTLKDIQTLTQRITLSVSNRPDESSPVLVEFKDLEKSEITDFGTFISVCLSNSDFTNLSSKKPFQPGKAFLFHQLI